MTEDFNVHMAVSEPEYRRLLAHARTLGIEAKPISADLQTVTIPVKLYLRPSEPLNSGKVWKRVTVNDRTYSNTLAFIEQTG